MHDYPLDVIHLENRETQLFQRFQDLDEKVAKMKLEMQAIETELTILAQRRSLHLPLEQYRHKEIIRDCVCDMVIHALQTPSMSSTIFPQTALSTKKQYNILKEVLERVFNLLPSYNASLRNHIITRTYNKLSTNKVTMDSDNFKRDLEETIMEEESGLSPMSSSTVMEIFCQPLTTEALIQYQKDVNIYEEERKLVEQSYLELFLEGYHVEQQAVMRTYIKEILISENNTKTMNNEEIKLTADRIFLRIRHSLLPPPPVVYFKGLVVGPSSIKARFNQIRVMDDRVYRINMAGEDVLYMDELPSITNEQHDDQNEHSTIYNEMRSMVSHHLPFLQSYACLAADLLA